MFAIFSQLLRHYTSFQKESVMSWCVPEWLRVSAVVALCSLPTALAQSGGLSPEWDVRKNLDALAAQARRMKPLLDDLKPQEWVAKGAPDTYVAQWKSAQSEIDSLVTTSENLAREPERLTVALEAFFRMESLESMLGSLSEGIGKYQNPALANLLRSLMTENATHREKLHRYIVELAAAKEQEFKVVDREAQRCRGLLSRQPPSAQNNDKKMEPK